MTEPIEPKRRELEELARGKLARVLGEAKALRVFGETLALAGLEGIETPSDLHAFGAVLARRGGFEGAIGGLLSVAAVMRGAAA